MSLPLFSPSAASSMVVPFFCRGNHNEVSVGKANAGLVRRTSTDDGKSWTKATSGVTTTLSGASVNTDTPVVSGSGGVLLYYDSANTKWEKATSPGSLDTYNLIGDGTKAVAVGRRGIAYFTADAGKTWKTTTTSLSVCLPLTSSTGAANGGACLYLCDPANNGKDCPGELTQCSPITVNGKNYHFKIQTSFTNEMLVKAYKPISGPAELDDVKMLGGYGSGADTEAF